MAKVYFYTVTYTHRLPDGLETCQDTMVLTRVELISFLRKGCKFDSIRPLTRPDFNNPQLFEQETTDDREENPVR